MDLYAKDITNDAHYPVLLLIWILCAALKFVYSQACFTML